MGKCPLNYMNECIYEECQLFIDWDGNKMCALYWMGMSGLLNFQIRIMKHKSERISVKHPVNILETGVWGTISVKNFRNNDFQLDYEILRDSLLLQDEYGNTIWVSTTDGEMNIKRMGNVEFDFDGR